MIELRTLGECDLRATSDGRQLRSVLAQPKRLALLAYLAVEHPGGFSRRDSLLPVFWPESDESRARTALRSGLYHLRRSLGDGVLIGRGEEEVGLDPERFWCDVTAFERAEEAGRPREAMELYGGDFLPGFHLSAAPAFEKWLDGTRARLRRGAGAMARRLAEQAAAEGSGQKAVGWARRALEIDPYDEEALRRLLVLLDGAGNRVQATRTWDRFRHRLASELGVEPSPETREVAERIQARDVVVSASEPGARNEETEVHEGQDGLGELARESGQPKGETSAVGDPEGRPPSRDDASGDATAEARRRFGRGAKRGLTPWGAVALVLALVGAAGLVRAMWPEGSTTSADDAAPAVEPQRVLVSDFEVEATDTVLADAVAEALRIELAGTPEITVATRPSVEYALRRMKRRPDERVVGDLAREVAVWSGSRTVLTGELREAGGGYVIAVRLMDAETGDLLRGWLETRPDSTSLGPAIADLAREVGIGVREALRASGPVAGTTDAQRGSTAPRTPPLPALRKYVQSVRAFESGDFLRAARLAEEAIAFDSTFAAAHVSLAYALSITYTSRGRELEALRRAYRLRDQLPELERYTVAGIYHRMASNLPAALDAFRSAAELSDGRVGEIGLGVIFIQTRDLEQAERILRRRRAAGERFVHYELLIRILHRQGRIEEALELMRDAERRFPGHPVFAEARVEFAIAAGDFAKADSLVEEIPLGGAAGLAERHPLFLRADIDAIRGRYAEALRHLEQLRELQLSRGMLAPAWNATIHAARLAAARGPPETGVAEIEGFLERVPPDSLHPLGSPFVYLPLADFFVEVGRPDRAREFLAAYDRSVESERRRQGRARRHLVRARLLAARDRTDDALASLRRALDDVRLHGQFDYDLPIQVPVGDRPEVARLYAAAGLRDSAIAVYERYLDNQSLRRHWLDAYELGNAHERLAELYADAGRPGRAARHYRELAELWEGADSGLQPRVEEALARSRALETGGG